MLNHGQDHRREIRTCLVRHHATTLVMVMCQSVLVHHHAVLALHLHGVNVQMRRTL